ncbi:hypothetical protein EsDP_00004183 [Epichloe bromicola]|uniref:Amino acid transporter transmembrane domain-containing protein n=1 Tax=Epichloe bromicola TaxID=79588 RepID=A0ABQ0CR03_9HYPO
MSSTSRNPTSWDEYDGRLSPYGSLRSTVTDEEDVVFDGSGHDGQRLILGPDARRSSVTNRLAAMADIGGINSFRSFARSWQRAASFAEVIPRRPSFVLAPEANAIDDLSNGEINYGRSHVDSNPQRSMGLLRQYLRDSPSQDTGAALSSQDNGAGSVVAQRSSKDDFREGAREALDSEVESGALLAESPSTRSSIFAFPPRLAAPDAISSYGTNYGTMSTGRCRSQSSASCDNSWDVRHEVMDTQDIDMALGEENPILVKEVKQGDRVVLTVEGQSTLPQSVFNSINAIIGIGLLSLPLAFRMSGWIIGLVILTFTAAVTAHTGKLLGKCMEYDPSIITYSDLAYIAFGARARVIVSTLFTVELIAACVALVILFSDSLNLLLPHIADANIWKCVCAALVLILNMLPLRWLSYTSVLGIFSTFCIVCIVIIDGLVKKDAPGSLWEPAKTYLLPSNWLSLPLAYGLMASPWGAHSVFPSIYRDMRHPHKWKQGVNITFSFSYVLDTCLAVIGILMFGDGIKEAITSNILRMSGYPKSLTVIMCIFITIIPLTKIPLNARPLITTADVVCGVHKDHPHRPAGSAAPPLALANGLRAMIRLVVVLVLLGISVLFPAFDSVCAFLGAALCSLISIVLPICFYLKLYHQEIPKRQRVISWLLLVTFSIFGLVGTVWTFLPKHLIGG